MATPLRLHRQPKQARSRIHTARPRLGLAGGSRRSHGRCRGCQEISGAFAGDGERVFCHPQKGSTLDHKRYATTLRVALARAGVYKHMRPFHDRASYVDHELGGCGRFTSGSHGTSRTLEFKTTQSYIDLAARRSEPKLNSSSSGRSASQPSYRRRPSPVPARRAPNAWRVCRQERSTSPGVPDAR